MADSLKDQLIALGLAKPGQDKGRAEKPRGKKTNKAGKKKKAGPMSLDAAYRLREREEIKSAEDKKRQKQEQDRLRRQVNTQIQQLADEHALNDSAAELKRNFLFKGRIRSVLVTTEQLKDLNEGRLGVVFLRGSYFVMQPEHVEQVRAISPDHVPDLGASESEEEEFPVPDDLMW